MTRKTKTVKKDSKKVSFISTIKLDLGNITHEANEVFTVDEIMANSLKESHFYRKWTIKEVKV